MANLRFMLLLAAVIGAFPATAAVAEEQAEAEREFTLRVLPLLKARCFACHGDDADDLKGALDLRSRGSLLAGGESEEPAIVPGDAEASLLYQAVKWDGLKMPPKENDRLAPAEIELLARWIAAGAPWPNEARQRAYRDAERARETTEEGVILKTSGGLSEEWTYRRYQPEDVWAFRPLREVAIPAGKDPIDFLIGRRLEGAGVSPAPRADAATLLRRATFDLLGLPPTPEEVEEFLAEWEEDSDGAWSALVDRLLASPHYGERWGQHWLDVARYADTGGYSNDYERSNMWRYRDYVVRALNEDKPYNEFIVEQLAGDELWEELPPEQRDAELLVATGFLRMGPWDPAMVKNPEARQIYLDDVVNAFWANLSFHHAPLREVPRPQVRPHSHARLLPRVRRVRGDSIGGAAGAAVAGGEPRGFRGGPCSCAAAAGVRHRAETATYRETRVGRPCLV